MEGKSITNPYFILNTIGMQKAGLTKAVIARMNMICEQMPDRNVNLLTLYFQRDFYEEVEEMKKKGALHPNVKVRNFFLDQDPTKGERDYTVTHEVEEEGLVHFKVKGQKLPSYRYYRDGFYVKYKRFNENNKLIFINSVNEYGVTYKREEFMPNGQCIREIYYDITTKKARLHRYLDNNGKCYLSVWMDEDRNWTRIQLFTDVNREFTDAADFYTYWFEKVIEKDPAPVLFSEFRDRLINLPKKNLDLAVLNVKHPTVRKVAFAHSNHYDAPYSYGSHVSAVWNNLFAHLDDFDQFIFLTEGQKNSVEALYGERDTFRVIPHFVEKPQVNVKNEYNPKLITAAARLQHKKRIEDAVKAIALVAKKVQDIRLEIYGFGYRDEYEESIHNLIAQLKVQKNVILKGFTENQAEIYNNACFSLLTSKSEGFGMALTESLAYGTPVISYDINFGPHDIITDGEDGFLVEDGNVKKLAEKMVLLLQNSELREQMSKNAPQVLQNFSYEHFIENWKNAFNDLDNCDPKITQPKVKLNMKPATKEVIEDTEHIKILINVEKSEDARLISSYIVERETTRMHFGEVQEIDSNLYEISFSKDMLDRLETIGNVFVRAANDYFTKDFRVFNEDAVEFFYQQGERRYRIYKTKQSRLSIKFEIVPIEEDPVVEEPVNPRKKRNGIKRGLKRLLKG